MKKYLGLSEIEFDLMTFFWTLGRPASFSEVFRFCNEKMEWKWAPTTAHTYITRLVSKKLLVAQGAAGVRRTYAPALSKKELEQRSAQEFVSTSFSGSMKGLLLSLVPSQTLSPEEAAELHRILDEMTVSSKIPDAEGNIGQQQI